MSSIVIKGNTSGQIEIAAPDVAGSTTLTLPTGTGTVLLSDGDGSNLTNLPQPAALTTASGSAPSYSARAWVNFNGTGTVAINASGNVSSITDNGVGKYTVNFTTAMSDASYGFAMNAQETVSSSGSDAPSVAPDFGSSLTTSSLSFNVVNAVGSSFLDCPNVSVTIFR